MFRLAIVMLLVGALLAVACQPAAPASPTVKPAATTGASATTPAASATKPAASGTQPAATGGSSSAAETEVAIQNFVFSPKTLTVPVGASVKWTNKDTVAHTASSGKGTFESGNLNQGQSFSFKFTQAGTYDYVCKYHANMTATVTVQ